MVTHALACALSKDPGLVRPFLKWLGIENVPKGGRLRVVEQQVPGEYVSGDEDERRGLPDMCVFTDDGWAVLFESKVDSKIGIGQLRRHIDTASRHGYRECPLVVLSVDLPTKAVREISLHKEWRDIYAWFRRRDSEWAREFATYIEVFENRMIARDYGIRGTMTKFDGIRFDDEHPYTYSEGKRLLRLMMDDLRGRKDLQRKLEIDPDGDGRPAITGRGGRVVWDLLPLRLSSGAGSFTEYPHLTLGVRDDGVNVAITVPHGVRGGFKRRLVEMGFEGFESSLLDVLEKLEPVLAISPTAKPSVFATQRHYPHRRATPINDANLAVDLRTIVPGGVGEVKYQPEWMESIYSVLSSKRSNIQFDVRVQLFSVCPVVRSVEVLPLIAKSWIAMKPLLDFVLE
jgi:hypothetical protein